MDYIICQYKVTCDEKVKRKHRILCSKHYQYNLRMREKSERLLGKFSTKDIAVRRNYVSEYQTWQQMIYRCHSSNNPTYKYYGARGIKVCDEWRESFANFLEHIGPKPCPNLSIDRIDNDGNYEPGNVRWATGSQQIANQRRVIYS